MISHVKDSTVSSGFGESISPPRGKSCVVIMSFFYRSEKNIKIATIALLYRS